MTVPRGQTTSEPDATWWGESPGGVGIRGGINKGGVREGERDRERVV